MCRYQRRYRYKQHRVGSRRRVLQTAAAARSGSRPAYWYLPGAVVSRVIAGSPAGLGSSLPLAGANETAQGKAQQRSRGRARRHMYRYREGLEIGDWSLSCCGQ